MKKEFLISLFLHALLLGSMMIPGCNGASQGDKEQTDKQNKPGHDDAGEIVPKGKPSSSPIQIEIVESFPKKEEKLGEDCPDGQWFGGIGIYEGVNSHSDTTVDKVIDGYPAHKAGMLAGDVIVYPSSYLIRGEPGTVLSITVNRDGKFINFQITRDKICIK